MQSFGGESYCKLKAQVCQYDLCLNQKQSDSWLHSFFHNGSLASFQLDFSNYPGLQAHTQIAQGLEKIRLKSNKTDTNLRQKTENGGIAI